MPDNIESVKSWTVTQNTSYALTTTSQKIADVDEHRLSILIRMKSDATNVAILQEADDDGEFPLEAGDVYMDSGEGIYLGEIWCKTDAGTDTIYVRELSR